MLVRYCINNYMCKTKLIWLENNEYNLKKKF